MTSRLLAFAHVQKAAGTTLTVLLRRHFGLSHLDVTPVRGWRYTKEHLSADLRLMPVPLKSLAGHTLRPFLDYGPNEARLAWYTILRSPVDRYISHFQHHVEKMGRRITVEEFLREPIQRNWQVQFLAGNQDVAAAKQILAEKCRFVGLTERFDESLVMLRHFLDLPQFCIAYGRPRNPQKFGDQRARILEQMDKYEHALKENNALDEELYAFAEALFAEQVAKYGRERLNAHINTALRQVPPLLPTVARQRANDVFRVAVYRPLVHRRGKSGGWSSFEDLRA